MKYFYFTNVKYFLTTKIYTWIHLLEISSSLGYRIATNSSHLPGFNCIIMCVCLFYVLITKNKPTIYKSELINERLTNSPFVDPFARNSFCLSLTLANAKACLQTSSHISWSANRTFLNWLRCTLFRFLKVVLLICVDMKYSFIRFG
jgi:hypothetical protein